MECPDVLRSLPHVPPSVETVICALADGQPLTGADLRRETGLPRRTVYAALQRIRDFGILHERASLRDARQSYFWIDDPHAMAGAAA